MVLGLPKTAPVCNHGPKTVAERLQDGSNIVQDCFKIITSYNNSNKYILVIPNPVNT